jgi:two-component system response regulator HydG
MSDNSARRPRILIADDSDVCRTVLAILLKNSGYDVTGVVNGRDALARLQDSPFDLAILDNDMPELDGLGTLAALRILDHEMPVIIVSATLSTELRTRYERLGIKAVRDKPVDPRALRDLVSNIFTQRDQKAVATASGLPTGTTAPFEVLGAADTALEKPVFAGGSSEVRTLVANFARLRAFRSAATISGRPGAAYLDVAIALAEERDAVLLACSATDVSVGHLTRLCAPALLHVQPVLLIVLQADLLTADQQELLDDLLRGGGQLSAFNGRARLILCAEKSLAALADAGSFNEDLLMRAGAMKLAVPALANRREDLPKIARAIIRRVGSPALRLPESTLDWLRTAPWTGDYIQLHRVIEIALIQSRPRDTIEVADLVAAVSAEPTWQTALYHDILLQSLGAK